MSEIDTQISSIISVIIVCCCLASPCLFMICTCCLIMLLIRGCNETNNRNIEEHQSVLNSGNVVIINNGR